MIRLEITFASAAEAASFLAAASGGAAAQIPPPLPPAAHSTAAAAAPPSAPEETPATGVTPPSAAILPAPPSAPEAAAPSEPAAPSSPAAVERDSRGIVWDARIHAANKSTNKDGSWRQRRGLDDESVKAAVEAELVAKHGRGDMIPPPLPGPATPLPAPPLPPVPPAVSVEEKCAVLADPAPAAAAAPWTFDRLLTAAVRANLPAAERDRIMREVAGVDAFGHLAALLQVDPAMGQRLADAWGLQ
jgi:hypothetical protein